MLSKMDLSSLLLVYRITAAAPIAIPVRRARNVLLFIEYDIYLPITKISFLFIKYKKLSTFAQFNGKDEKYVVQRNKEDN